MPLTNQQAVSRFLEYRKGDSTHVHSFGDALFSYSTIIAQWFGKDTMVMNLNQYSTTTGGKHQTHLRRAINDLKSMGITVIIVDHRIKLKDVDNTHIKDYVAWGEYDLTEYFKTYRKNAGLDGQ